MLFSGSNIISLVKFPFSYSNLLWYGSLRNFIFLWHFDSLSTVMGMTVRTSGQTFTFKIGDCDCFLGYYQGDVVHLLTQQLGNFLYSYRLCTYFVTLSDSTTVTAILTHLNTHACYQQSRNHFWTSIGLMKTIKLALARKICHLLSLRKRLSRLCFPVPAYYPWSDFHVMCSITEQLLIMTAGAALRVFSSISISSQQIFHHKP